MRDRISPYSPDKRIGLTPERVLLLAFLAWWLSGCVTDPTYSVSYPDLDPQANCRPVVTYPGEKKTPLPGVKMVGENHVYTRDGSLEVTCDSADRLWLVEKIMDQPLTSEVPFSYPLKVELPRNGNYQLIFEEEECGVSTVSIYQGDHKVGEEAGDSFCETDSGTIEITRDSEAPRIEEVRSGVLNSSLVIEGTVMDGSGQEISLRGKNNQTVFKPVMAKPGQVIRLALPLSPGENQLSLEACDLLENCAPVPLPAEVARLNYDPANLAVVESQEIEADGSFVVRFLVPDLTQSLDFLAGVSPRFQQESLLFGNNWPNTGTCETKTVTADAMPGLNHLTLRCRPPRKDGLTEVSLHFVDRHGQKFEKKFRLKTGKVPELKRIMAQGGATAAGLLALIGTLEVVSIFRRKRKEKVRSERTRWFNEAIEKGNLEGATDVYFELGGFPKDYVHLLESRLILDLTECYLHGSRLKAWGRAKQEERKQGYIEYRPQDYGRVAKRLGKGFYRPENHLVALAKRPEQMEEKTKFLESHLPIDRATDLNAATYLLSGLYNRQKQPAPLIETLRTQVFLDFFKSVKESLAGMVTHFETGELSLLPLGKSDLSREYLFQLLVDERSWFYAALDELERNAALKQNMELQRQILEFKKAKGKVLIILTYLDGSWERVRKLDTQTGYDFLMLLYTSKRDSELKLLLAKLPENSPAKRKFLIEIEGQFVEMAGRAMVK